MFAADEYYLLAERPFPPADAYEDFPMHEDGIGMARTLEAEFHDPTAEPTGTQAGFFAWVDGAPADGYRAPRIDSPALAVAVGRSASDAGRAQAPSQCAGRRADRARSARPVLAPLLAEIDRDDVRVIPVPNRYFGGNIGVTRSDGR